MLQNSTDRPCSNLMTGVTRLIFFPAQVGISFIHLTGKPIRSVISDTQDEIRIRRDACIRRFV